jgi:hypothetical protein
MLMLPSGCTWNSKALDFITQVLEIINVISSANGVGELLQG